LKALLSLAASLLTASLLTAAPISAHAAPQDAANAVRSRGCAGVAAPAPLRDSPKLKAAAEQLAQGLSLRDALAAAGYLDSQSAALHLSGAGSDADVARMLGEHYCKQLANPAYREIGGTRRGSEIYLIIAAPAPIPIPADAEQVVRSILFSVNLARAAGRRCGTHDYPPAAPLILNSALTSAALAHSRDMADHGEFDHQGHDGSTPAVRIARAGYGPYLMVGENIAAGPMNPDEVVKGWLASPGHCENIMEGRFKDIGIAFAVNVRSAGGIYWTQDFALHR
jgi:uncharacterized protein YkwD